jgi:mannose-1-phosphate guanylyltransferase
MEAIILAGGFGTRLRPLTYTRAKSLLPILNKPMIMHLIDSLPSEVGKVILAVNYRKDQIEEYFSKNNCGKDIIINNEKTPLGTGGATKFAERHITDRFFVLNSDIICSVHLDKMIKFHKKNNSVSTISLWPVDNVSEFGVADVKNDGNIVRFIEKPKPKEAPSNFINAGAYLLEPEILDYIQIGRLVSMEKEIFPKIIKNTGRFYGFKFEGYWMDIGRISSYLEVNKFLLDNKKLDFNKGVNCKINGSIQKSSIGDNVYVGNNSNIKESIVFDNVKIGNNVILSNCIIGENSEISEGCKLKNVVIGDNEIIKEKTILENTFIWTQPKPDNYPDKQIGNPIIN